MVRWFARMVLLPLLASIELAAALSAEAAPIEVVSTDNPPFNYLDGTTPAGLGTDILQAMLQRAGLEPHVEFLPWQRALLRVEQRPDTLIYTLARTPEREAHYEWIGPFAPRQLYFWKLKRRSDIRLTTLKDVRQWRVATVRADAQTDLMFKLDLVDPQKVSMPTSDDSVVRMLYAGRVDLIANSEVTIQWRLKELHLDPSQIERSVMLLESGGYYFAFGKGADPALVARVRRAFDEVKAAGTLQRTLQHYLPGQTAPPNAPTSAGIGRSR